MFHWICPECGREIPPTVRECQACDPAAAVLVAVEPPKSERSKSIAETSVARPEPSSVVETVTALAVVAEKPPAVTPAPQVEKSPAVEIASPLLPVPAVAAAPAPVAEKWPEVAAEPEAEKAASVAEKLPVVEAVAAPAAEKPVPAEPAVLELPVVAAPAPAAEKLPAVEVVAEPAVETPVPAEAPFVAAPPVVEAPAPVAAEALPVVAQQTIPTPELVAPKHPAVKTEPPPAKPIEVPDPLLALAEEIRAAQTARAQAVAEAPAPEGLLELAGAIAEHQPAPAPAEPVAPAAKAVAEAPKHSVEPQLAIAPAPSAIALLAPPEPQTVPPLVEEPVGFRELRPAAHAPEPQVSAQPEPVALAEPQAQPAAPAQEPEGPTLPFAPMQDYTPATSRSIQPVPPRAQILSADSGPRITLPGPTLPPELARLKDANVVTVIGEDTAQRTKEAIPPTPKNTGAPGWLVSAFVMLLLLAAGLGIVFYLLPHTVADAKPAPTPAAAATAPAPQGGSSPLAKYVEVTGFRIVSSKADSAKKSEVQYLIVNHSDADISDVNVFVTLRSVKPGQAPVCRFSFKVPSLGPFESKEMSSPIENAARAVSLPGWQEMRADVQISQ
jgi:hypothetical protein